MRNGDSSKTPKQASFTWRQTTHRLMQLINSSASSSACSIVSFLLFLSRLSTLAFYHIKGGDSLVYFFSLELEFTLLTSAVQGSAVVYSLFSCWCLSSYGLYTPHRPRDYCVSENDECCCKQCFIVIDVCIIFIAVMRQLVADEGIYSVTSSTMLLAAAGSSLFIVIECVDHRWTSE